jgi:hypothetical protein
MLLFYLLPKIGKENLDPVPRLDYFLVLDAIIQQFRIPSELDPHPCQRHRQLYKGLPGRIRVGREEGQGSPLVPTVPHPTNHEMLELSPCLEILVQMKD